MTEKADPPQLTRSEAADAFTVVMETYKTWVEDTRHLGLNMTSIVLARDHDTGTNSLDCEGNTVEIVKLLCDSAVQFV